MVAALLAAAGRTGAAQSEACRALSRGLTSLPAANVEKRGLAVGLCGSMLTSKTTKCPCCSAEVQCGLTSLPAANVEKRGQAVRIVLFDLQREPKVHSLHLMRCREV